MNILQQMEEAGEAGGNVAASLEQYKRSIAIAKEKFEALAKSLEEVINQPHIELGDFEIDG